MKLLLQYGPLLLLAFASALIDPRPGAAACGLPLAAQVAFARDNTLQEAKDGPSSHIAGPDGHLSPAAFDFVRPGVARSVVYKRLGKPGIRAKSVVVAGEIDLFVDSVPTEPRLGGKPQPVEDVVYYEYASEKYPSEFARIVFRKNKVWYAMLPPRDLEKTRPKLLERYGQTFELQNISRRNGHILSVHEILWLRKAGLAFVEVPGFGITHRVVFPAQNDDKH